MKIALVIADLGAGGAERVLSILANEWINKGHSVNVILLAKGPSFYELDPRIEVTELGFKTHSGIFSRLVSIFKISLLLRKHVKMTNPDFILSFMNKYNIFVLLSLFKTKNKIYVSERDSPTEKLSKVTVFLRDSLYRFAEGVICQTEMSRDFIILQTKNKNVTAIPNPVSDCILDESIERENIILNVGRLVEKKGQKYLIEAFSKIENKEWKLYIAGDGHLKEELINYVEQLELGERVVFLGSRKDVSHWYQKAKIFAFPSIFEGFPNALAEAMTYGLACVSFDCFTGPSDIIEDGVNGYLVEERNVNEFTDRFNYLIEHEKKRLEFSENATKLRNALNKERISDEYLNFCNSHL